MVCVWFSNQWTFVQLQADEEEEEVVEEDDEDNDDEEEALTAMLCLLTAVGDLRSSIHVEIWVLCKRVSFMKF